MAFTRSCGSLCMPLWVLISFPLSKFGRNACTTVHFFFHIWVINQSEEVQVAACNGTAVCGHTIASTRTVQYLLGSLRLQKVSKACLGLPFQSQSKQSKNNSNLNHLLPIWPKLLGMLCLGQILLEHISE